MTNTIPEIIKIYLKQEGFALTEMMRELEKQGVFISYRTLTNWNMGETIPYKNALNGWLQISTGWAHQMFKEMYDLLTKDDKQEKI